MPSSPPTRHPHTSEVKWLSVLLAAGAGLLVLAVVFPMSEQAPVELGALGAAVGFVMAAVTWVLGARLPRGALLGQAVFAASANSVLVAEAHTRAGAMGDAFAYAWLALYVGVFFPRAVAWFCGLVATGYGAGLLAGDLTGMVAPWAVVSVSVTALGMLAAGVTGALRRLAETDPLTGAANRSGLARAGEALVLRRSRAPKPVTVVTLDLDDFKAVNDLHGHATGDRLLVEAVAAWQTVLRRDDVLARTGGDEFVLLMPSTTAAQADRVVERLRAAHPVAWSAGIAEVRPDEALGDGLERADQRLYAAKHGGSTATLR